MVEEETHRSDQSNTILELQYFLLELHQIVLPRKTPNGTAVTVGLVENRNQPKLAFPCESFEQIGTILCQQHKTNVIWKKEKELVTWEGSIL